MNPLCWYLQFGPPAGTEGGLPPPLDFTEEGYNIVSSEGQT